jgi:formate dehydrogenase maturation protein FdhE
VLDNREVHSLSLSAQALATNRLSFRESSISILGVQMNGFENRLKVKQNAKGKDKFWCPACESFPNNNFIERGMTFHSHTDSDCLSKQRAKLVAEGD